MIKRLIDEKAKTHLKELATLKNKKNYTQVEINRIVILIAKKLKLL